MEAARAPATNSRELSEVNCHVLRSLASAVVESTDSSYQALVSLDLDVLVGMVIHCVQKKNTHSHFLSYLHE